MDAYIHRLDFVNNPNGEVDIVAEPAKAKESSCDIQAAIPTRKFIDSLTASKESPPCRTV